MTSTACAEVTDLLELTVDGSDEGDGVASSGSDGDARHLAAGPRHSGLPCDCIRAVDWVIHVTLAAVRVVNREQLNRKTHHYTLELPTAVRTFLRVQITHTTNTFPLV